ncbi:hypothetical protein KJ605_01955 [Patescibacteria group bacterium]|nr:hypothetical protein [Patescibacteria group bacterium]MBU1970518.1 hypothetical protein [Patescibacteria group bacterium]
MKDAKNVVIVVLVTILVGGASFYGGTLYQKSKTINALTRQFGTNAGRFADRSANPALSGSAGRAGAGFRPIVGEILGKDDSSLTVKMQDGSSKIILLTETTAINRAEKIEASALNAGDTVRVMGVTNTDGSVTAQDIQLNPVQLGQQAQ